jgi:hypothetical protein
MFDEHLSCLVIAQSSASVSIGSLDQRSGLRAEKNGWTRRTDAVRSGPREEMDREGPNGAGSHECGSPGLDPALVTTARSDNAGVRGHRQWNASAGAHGRG